MKLTHPVYLVHTHLSRSHDGTVQQEQRRQFAVTGVTHYRAHQNAISLAYKEWRSWYDWCEPDIATVTFEGDQWKVHG